MMLDGREKRVRIGRMSAETAPMSEPRAQQSAERRRAEQTPDEGLAGAAADREREQAINQRIFETSLDLILVVDRKGSFIRVSPSCEAILGYRPEEMVGRSAAEFLYPADLESTRNEMRLARRGRLMRHFQCRYLHKDGRVVTLAWTGVWSDSEQQHFFIGRDMTEHIKLETQLRQAQKMEAIGQLTGGIAHDFNNLLSVAIGSIELMFDSGLSAQAAEHGRNALHAAQRGAELTRRLLAFARQQPLAPKVVDANELIGNFTRLLRQTIGQHIQVEFTKAPGLWPLFIDPANLESAIANLSVNSRDAMPNGGRLLIETQNATLDEQFVQDHPGATAGDYVAIIVTDTGTGMPADVVERIFEPFFTTKEPGKGTGLGLAMVYGFVKQSGGYIKAYSEVGHGTSFRLYLPRANNLASAEPAASPAEQRPAAGRQEHILVVEDNDAIRQVVLIQLAKLGYKTLEANGPAAALKLIDAGEPIDLLFTDVVMPGGMSGVDLARDATARRPPLKVLFTSGFPGALTAGDGGIPADAVLGKPYRAQDLARKIRAALDR
jgi:PAS domain S-box-containing protein